MYNIYYLLHVCVCSKVLQFIVPTWPAERKPNWFAYNSDFEKILIEIHWFKNVYYKNNLMQIFNPSVNNETKLELR